MDVSAGWMYPLGGCIRWVDVAECVAVHMITGHEAMTLLVQARLTLIKFTPHPRAFILLTNKHEPCTFKVHTCAVYIVRCDQVYRTVIPGVCGNKWSWLAPAHVCVWLKPTFSWPNPGLYGSGVNHFPFLLVSQLTCSTGMA